MRKVLIRITFAAVIGPSVVVACARGGERATSRGEVAGDDLAGAAVPARTRPAPTVDSVNPTPADTSPRAEPSAARGIDGTSRRVSAGEAGSGSRARSGPASASDAAHEAGRGGAGPAVAGDSAAAEKVLKEAAEAYERLNSLQAEFVQRLDNPLLESTKTSRGTIYQRRPDRFLMRFSDPKGDVIVADGQTLWVYYPSVDPDQVIRSRGNAGAMDLQAQFLGDPLKRFAPALKGGESVDGRPATVLELEPRLDTGYDLLRIWVDDRDHLVRRFEIHESSGIVRHFRLSGLRANPVLSDSLFRFEPPAGATIVDRS